MYLYKLAYMKFWENSVDTRADAVEGCLTLWERLDDPMDSTGCIVECNDDAEPIGKVEWIDCSEYFDDEDDGYPSYEDQVRSEFYGSRL